MVVETQYRTVRETADALRVSPASVYRACERGDLEHVRLSPRGAIRIPTRVLDDGLAALRRST
jgi:hypothetical protein